MEIDPQTLAVTLAGPQTAEEVLDAPHFHRFHAQTADSIDHYDGWRQHPRRVRYDAFTVDPAGRLRSRTKYQELLRGTFGTVYGETTYYYGGQTRVVFHTAAYGNEIEHEPPEIVAADPAQEQHRLIGVSVVRIFRAPPEFLVVSANYDPHGTLRSLHVNGARNGDWVHPSLIGEPYRGWGVATTFGDARATRAHYGIPEAFPVSDFEAAGMTGFGETALARELDVVHFHYDANSWVRQDLLPPAGLRGRRFLRFRVTEQDRMLASRDEAAAE
jgi:hypothetical protein